MISFSFWIGRFAIAAHRQNHRSLAAATQAAIGEERVERILDRHDSRVDVFERPLDALAHVDATCVEIVMHPAQREHLAIPEASQCAQCIGQGDRVGEREEDAADIIESLHEGCGAWIMRWSNQTAGRAREGTHGIDRQMAELDDVAEERAELEDAQAHR